jgi:toxin YoeB
VKLVFSSQAWEDYLYWQATDRTILKRVNLLITALRRDNRPLIGKPERLRGELSGWCSVRVTSEHRLVYRHTETAVEIAACRGHYDG